MKAVNLCMLAALACVIPGSVGVACSGSQTVAVIADLTPSGACVLSEVEAGATPLQVLGACAGTTIQGIIAIVETYLAHAVVDAGLAVPASRQVYIAFLDQAKAYAAAHP